MIPNDVEMDEMSNAVRFAAGICKLFRMRLSCTVQPSEAERSVDQMKTLDVGHTSFWHHIETEGVPAIFESNQGLYETLSIYRDFLEHVKIGRFITFQGDDLCFWLHPLRGIEPGGFSSSLGTGWDFLGEPYAISAETLDSFKRFLKSL